MELIKDLEGITHDSFSSIASEIIKNNDRLIKHVLSSSFSDEYIRIIENHISQYITKSEYSKYRWVAIIYYSDALKKLIFNRPIFFTGAQKEEHVFLQKNVFKWYEDKAEVGHICSVFQMALNKEFDIAHRPYFGFSRTINFDNRTDNQLIDIYPVLPDEIVRHYNDLLKLRLKAGVDPIFNFGIVNEIIEIICQSILSTHYGLNRVINIKHQLQDITGNTNIARKNEHEILATLICLAIIDPDWRYYYYIPFHGVCSVPYGAIAFTSIEPCSGAHIDFDSCLSNTFHKLEQIENLLFRKRSNLKKNVSQNETTLKGVFSAIEDSFSNALNINLKLLGNNEKFDPTKVDAIINLTREGYKLIINKSGENSQIKSTEINSLIREVDEVIPTKFLEISRPISANNIELNGWLDVDIIASTKINARLRNSVSLADTLSRLIREYFDKCILGNGALRFVETPDGWMCGFPNIDNALNAAFALILNLDTFNRYLQQFHPDIAEATTNGIGLRIGVHFKLVDIQAEKRLQEVYDDTLNKTGHFQKKGGDELAKYLHDLDDKRPSNIDSESRFLWVLTMGQSTYEEYIRLISDDRSLARSFDQYLDKAQCHRISRKISGDPVKIIALEKPLVTNFDKIDRFINVDSISYKGERTYPYIRDEASAVINIATNNEKQDNNIKTILDIGSGSGIYAFTLALIYPNATLISVEPNQNSVDVWNTNLKLISDIYKTKSKHILKSMTFKDFIRENNSSFDLLVANLPYIPNNCPEKIFVHSNGGISGLEIFIQVLDWMLLKDTRIQKAVFPMYSLAKDENIESTYLFNCLNERKTTDKYSIQFHDNFLPNWFVLGYSNDPSKFFLKLESAFPESRRRKDVAEWIYELKEKKDIHFMWHTILEMKLK